jgi:carbon storage regulator
MLILTRRPRETVFIGHDVVVTVLDIRGDRVRLGINAPREIEVQREERLATNKLPAPAAAPSPAPHSASQH